MTIYRLMPTAAAHAVTSIHTAAIAIAIISNAPIITPFSILTLYEET